MIAYWHNCFSYIAGDRFELTFCLVSLVAARWSDTHLVMCLRLSSLQSQVDGTATPHSTMTQFLTTIFLINSYKPADELQSSFHTAVI